MGSLVEKFGRMYFFAGLGLVFSAVLSAIFLYQKTDQYVWIFNWWKDLLIWLIPLVGGTKAVQKIGIALSSGKATAGNGETISPNKNTATEVAP